MSLMSNTSWVSESGEPYQIKDSALTEEPKRAPTFTTLPLEIRLQIYGYNLSSFKRTLRRREDCDQHTKIKVFDTGLLAVNEQLNAETVPLLYANHTFHYSVSSRPSIPSHSLKWLKHASIGFTTRAGLPTDAILATRIQELAASSPNLRTLTLHVIEIDSNASSMKGVQQLSPVGHWARAARGLLPRLDRLSIITCGVWARREDFRQFITAEGSQWAEEALIQWPLIALGGEQTLAVVVEQASGLLNHASNAVGERIPGSSIPSLGSSMNHGIRAYHVHAPGVAWELKEGKSCGKGDRGSGNGAVKYRRKIRSR